VGHCEILSLVESKHTPAVRLGLKENWRQFSLLILANAFVGGMIGLERTVVPLIGSEQFGLVLKTAIFSFIVSFGVVKACSNLVSGALADTFSRKSVLVAGWLIGVPVPFMIMFAPSWGWIVGANILLGINQGLAWSMTVLMKIDLVGPRGRGLAVGLNEFAGYLAVGLTAFGTGYLASAYGLRPEPFYLGVGYVILGLLISIFLVRDTSEHVQLEMNQYPPEPTLLTFREVFTRTSFKDRNLFACSQAGLVNNLNDGMSWGVFPLFFSAFGLGVERIGLLKAAYPAVWGCLQVLTGPLSDRWGRKWLIVAGMWTQAAGLLWFWWADGFPEMVGAAVVLGAGEGTRMRSDVPKILHHAAGRPLVVHVLAALETLALETTVLVTSPRRAEIEKAIADAGFGDGVSYAVQDPPRGTGDATRVGLDELEAETGTVMVVPGDTPLLQVETLRSLLELHTERGAAATVLTARVTDPSGYGRIVRDDDGDVKRIVEDGDVSYEEHAIDEINAGVFVFDAPKLNDALNEIGSANAQGEYYLTDVVGVLTDRNEVVAAYRTHQEEVQGVNSRAQLARAAGLLRRRACEQWMDRGVTIVDPDTTYIDAAVAIGRDAVIHPFTFLEGGTAIGDRAEVGPQARLVDTEVGEGAKITFSVCVESIIGPDASVGPYASLRPGTVLERGAKIGTFVETKNVTLGEGSRANHLAYLGDAVIGRGVNVGAGTITCNWDGREKHQTVIEDDAYIGSDTMLVAPTRIGKRAATGAGAVVRGDVPDDALAVGAPARIIEGKGNKMGAAERENDPESSDG
jgi:UDP-N-acetylglucosamine diphosphorylase/glucosamine-1-phosphate N-acetyltransferase